MELENNLVNLIFKKIFAIIIIESKRRKVRVYLFSSTAISTDSARSLNP